MHIHTHVIDLRKVNAETSCSDFTENHAVVCTCMPVLIFNTGLYIFSSFK